MTDLLSESLTILISKKKIKYFEKNLTTLSNLFDISLKVKISDISNLIEIQQEKFKVFIKYDRYNYNRIQISDNFVQIDSKDDIHAFLSLLDKKFED